MSTLIQLRTDVLLQGFEQTRLGSVIDAKLNEGLQRVARRLLIRFEEVDYAISTVASTATYAIPSDLLRVRSVRDTTTPRQLSVVDVTDMDSYVASSGRPRIYAIDASNLRFYPTPDAVYSMSLRYWKNPATLVNDTDIPGIPADYHDLLATWAKARLYEYEDDVSMAQYFQAKFTTDLNAAAADLQNQDVEATQVPSMWDADRRASGTWYPSFIDSST